MSAEYRRNCQDDFWAVYEGSKPLLIVSSGKSLVAYETCAAWADINGMKSEFASFVCEDGELHEHVFICREGAPYAREAIDAIFDAVQEFPTRSRKNLQLTLGMLLGHSAHEALEFVNSQLGKTCQCDCCGGSETVDRSVRQRQIRRTMFHAA